MQLQAQPKIVYVMFRPGNLPDDFRSGKWGDPVYYRHDDAANYVHNHWIKRNHPIGTILIMTHVDTGERYTYVIKEYKNGWWKLEWPD